MHRCLDLLINNAEIDYNKDQRVMTAALARVHRATGTNLFGPWATTIAAVPMLKQSKEGQIANVASGAGALNALTIKTVVKLSFNDILVNRKTLIISEACRCRTFPTHQFFAARRFDR